MKYPFLWRLGYTFTQPRIVHVPVQSVMGVIMGRQISEAFDRYQPDLVVSVHPLMQVLPFCCSSLCRSSLLLAESLSTCLLYCLILSYGCAPCRQASTTSLARVRVQAVPLRVLRQREAQGISDRISFATVVTDLSTCHNTWFHKGVDRCFVATPEAAERAVQMGLQPEQVCRHCYTCICTTAAPPATARYS